MKFQVVIGIALILLTCGCQHTSKDPKGEAAQQWNGARASVLASLAKDQYQAGDFEKSRQSIDEAIKLDPNNAGLHVTSAKLAIEQGQLEVAERELTVARELAPESAEAYYLSGVVYQRWQKPDVAFSFYGIAGQKAPAELAYLLAQAEMLVAMDRADEALPLLQSKVVYFEHSYAIRDAVGQLLMQQGRYAQAVEMLRQASILAEDDMSCRERLGLALYYDKQYGECVNTLSEVVKKEPFASRTDLLSALGESQLQLGQAREAKATFETAAQADPSAAHAWLGLGKAALETGDFKRAELALRRALTLDPADSQKHLMLGYVRLRQNKLSEALSAFQKANALDNADTVSLCMIGYVFEKTGRQEQAMNYYAKALKLKPGDEMAARLLAGIDLQN